MTVIENQFNLLTVFIDTADNKIGAASAGAGVNANAV